MIRLYRFILTLVIITTTAPSCRSLQNSGHLESTGSKTAKVLFHPYDPTLDRIADALTEAEENIDIAMYSLDVSNDSPVMKALASNTVQRKLQNGTIAIRMVFEGYGSAQENRARSAAVEALGVDVRSLRGGRMVHHKFAVIDGGTSLPRVITGSANWSLSSMRAYDENIMFWTGFPGIATAYQNEFNLLWSASEEYGNTVFASQYANSPNHALETGFAAYFNSANYTLKNGQLVKDPSNAGWTITRGLVAAIDSAQTTLDVATTRIVLRPVYNALLRAAARGVKITIAVNQDQYDYQSVRQRWQLATCSDEYEESCSKDQDHSWFLVNETYPGKQNVSVRVKFFSLNTRVTLAKQMHSKYMIVDGTKVFSGSFNWSSSAEWHHIENALLMEGADAQPAIDDFRDNYTTVYEQGRANYQPYVDRIDNALKTGVRVDCSFGPMALTFTEIDWLLDIGRRNGKPFKDACI